MNDRASNAVDLEKSAYFMPYTANCEFKKAPRHPKWREVSLAAQLPGWTRFEAAQTWLDARAGQATQASVEKPPGLPQATKMDGPARRGAPNAVSQNDAALYQEFLQWKRLQPGR